MKPSITGHIASWATTIIAVVAMRAGARKAKYSTPPSSSVDDVDWSTSEPTPTPMPRRYSSGCTKLPSRFDFQIRL